MTASTTRGSRLRSGIRTVLIALGLLLVPVVIVVIAGVIFVVMVFHVPPPPDGVAEASEASERRIRAIDGVLDVVIDVTPIDLKDGGPLTEAEAWRAEVVARIEPGFTDLRSLARRIDSEAADLQRTVTTEGVVRIPADSNGAELTLWFSASRVSNGSAGEFPPAVPIARAGSAAAAVEAATALRTPSAIEVSVDARSGQSSIGVDTPDQLVDAVAATTLVRADGGPLASIVVWTSDSAGSRSGSISIGTGSPPPSTESTAAVARVIDEPGVRMAALDTARDTTIEREESWRPHLDVQVASIDDVDATASVIAGIEIAVGGVSPRPSFRVSDSTGERVIDGFLGLPLGSDAPSDALPGQPAVDSGIIPLTPEQDDAVVRKSLVLVESILLEAASTAGIDIESNAAVVACETRGRRAIGSVLIPVIDGAAGQQETFDAITQSWLARGFSRGDRALGADLYFGEGLQQLSIRGTAEGISIDIASTCSA